MAKIVHDPVIVSEDSRVSLFVPMSFSELGRVIGVGAITGLLVAILMHVLNNFVFASLLCRQSANGCEAAPVYSMIVAIVIGSVFGLAGLARLRVYRPLLVVLAAAVSLWSFHVLVAGWVWYQAGLVSIILFALAYGLFAWVARARSILITIALVIAIVVAMRFAIS